MKEDSFEIKVGDYSAGYKDLVRYSLSHDCRGTISTFDFTIYGEDVLKLRNRFTPLMPVEISINGKPQLVGRINTVAGNSNSTITVTGADYFQEMSKANVDPRITFKKQDTLENALLKVLAPFGVFRIVGYDAKRNLLTGRSSSGERIIDKDVKMEEFKVRVGQGCLEVCNKIASRHGCVLQPGLSRNEIILCQPNYDQRPMYLIERSASGNVLSSSSTRDWSNVPSVVTLKTKVKGMVISKGTGFKGGDQLVSGYVDGEYTLPAIGEDSPNRLHLIPEVRKILENVRMAEDPLRDTPEAMPPNYFGPSSANYIWRPVYHEDRESRSMAQVSNAIKKVIADRVIDTLRYSCSVSGHVNEKTGIQWAVNTIAYVRDEVEMVDEPMWINRVTFRRQRGGTKTDLELIRPHTWVIG